MTPEEFKQLKPGERIKLDSYEGVFIGTIRNIYPGRLEVQWTTGAVVNLGIKECDKITRALPSDIALGPRAAAALAQWLATGTWHTDHDLDMARWYTFVDQYQREYGDALNEGALCEHIANTAGANEAQRNTIRERVCLAGKILGFLKKTGR